MHFSSCVFYLFTIPVIVLMVVFSTCTGRQMSQKKVEKLRLEVKSMFHHAYDSYIQYAYPYDELRPLSCDGVDTWGSYYLTLIDALDTLAVMENYTEFRRVVDILSKKADFDTNINVSVFETNIRIVGGLLSAHGLSFKAGVELEPGWPCNGPLLRLATDVATRLLPAFNTHTGMPYGTVNLRYGVPQGETPITCTAGVGTFIVEFGTLSRLTGDPIYEQVALRSLRALRRYRSTLGLVGNHIDVTTGRWTAQDAGIGAGVDSYYEYLVKGAILLGHPQLMEMFKEARTAIDKYVRKDDWHFWVTMHKAQVTLPVFQSLEAFWPGLLSLTGDISSAMKTLLNYHQVWKQYGFTPEFYNVQQGEASNNRDSYPLRPELIESIMYLYRATKDPILLEMGEDIVTSIQHSAKTSCGYATVKDVHDHRLEDRMESFFLAETTKYLYLLFDSDNFLHNSGNSGDIINGPHGGECIIHAGGYIFNTEAHPIDPSLLHCCSSLNLGQQMAQAALLDSKQITKFQQPAFEERNVQKEQKEKREVDKSDGVVLATEHAVDTGVPSSIVNTTGISSAESDARPSFLDLVRITSTPANPTPVASTVWVPWLTPHRPYDPLALRDKVHDDHVRTLSNTTKDASLLTCPSQAFMERLAILGEVMEFGV